jgi:hypothetical protein
LLAALSRSLPRVAWADFPVEPETLMRSAMSTLPLPPTRPRHEIHPAFDEIFRTETIRVIPHADPGAERQRHAERWVRTLLPQAVRCVERCVERRTAISTFARGGGNAAVRLIAFAEEKPD